MLVMSKNKIQRKKTLKKHCCGNLYSKLFDKPKNVLTTVDAQSELTYFSVRFWNSCGGVMINYPLC
jgi:hypothetical protein